MADTYTTFEVTRHHADHTDVISMQDAPGPVSAYRRAQALINAIRALASDYVIEMYEIGHDPRTALKAIHDTAIIADRQLYRVGPLSWDYRGWRVEEINDGGKMVFGITNPRTPELDDGDVAFFDTRREALRAIDSRCH